MAPIKKKMAIGPAHKNTSGSFLVYILNSDNVNPESGPRV
jgi:hypothetical protein